MEVWQIQQEQEAIDIEMTVFINELIHHIYKI